MATSGQKPSKIVEDKGMKQVSDTGLIQEVVARIISENLDKAEAYRSGKKGLSGFFIGQVMREMKGQANPKVVNQIVTEELEK